MSHPTPTPRRGVKNAPIATKHLDMFKELAAALAVNEGKPIAVTDLRNNLSMDISSGHLSPRVVHLTGSGSFELRKEIGLTIERNGNFYGAVVRTSPSTYTYLRTARWVTKDLVRLPRGVTTSFAQQVANATTSLAPMVETRNGKLVLPDYRVSLGRRLRRENDERTTHQRHRGLSDGTSIGHKLAYGHYETLAQVKRDLDATAFDAAEHDLIAILRNEWGERFDNPHAPITSGAEMPEFLSDFSEADLLDDEPEPVAADLPTLAAEVVVEDAAPGVEIIANEDRVGGALVLRTPEGQTIVATITAVIR